MKEKGFSVIELSAAVAILATLCSISASPLVSAIESYRLTAASSAISATLYRARGEAVTLNTSRDVIFSPATNSYGIDANGNGLLDVSEAQLLPPTTQIYLPSGVTGPAAIRFNSRGEMPLTVPSSVLPGAPSIRVSNFKTTQQVNVSLRGSVSITTVSH
ncbi:MAG TPA: prepilin-type N-terminal cleavage/methylation domain-containing protein [Blastocatellia bacterium]|nr:prepilin-type N-terminal cleavage/methylation domain-containing protein [Blastocatellia bacterium]